MALLAPAFRLLVDLDAAHRRACQSADEALELFHGQHARIVWEVETDVLYALYTHTFEDAFRRMAHEPSAEDVPIEGVGDAPRGRVLASPRCCADSVGEGLRGRLSEPHEGGLSRAVDVVGEIIPIGVVQCVQVYSVCSHRHVHI